MVVPGISAIAAIAAIATAIIVAVTGSSTCFFSMLNASTIIGLRAWCKRFTLTVAGACVTQCLCQACLGWQAHIHLTMRPGRATLAQAGASRCCHLILQQQPLRCHKVMRWRVWVVQTHFPGLLFFLGVGRAKKNQYAHIRDKYDLSDYGFLPVGTQRN